MYFFNYIYFLIITVAGVKFLFTKQDIVTHPLDKKKKILLDGPELLGTDLLYRLVGFFSTRNVRLDGYPIDDTGNIPFGWTVYSKTKTTMEHSSNSIYDLYDMANYRIELYFICKLWISCHIKIQLSSADYAFCLSSSKGQRDIFKSRADSQNSRDRIYRIFVYPIDRLFGSGGILVWNSTKHTLHIHMHIFFSVILSRRKRKKRFIIVYSIYDSLYFMGIPYQYHGNGISSNDFFLL